MQIEHFSVLHLGGTENPYYTSRTIRVTKILAASAGQCDHTFLQNGNHCAQCTYIYIYYLDINIHI